MDNQDAPRIQLTLNAPCVMHHRQGDCPFFSPKGKRYDMCYHEISGPRCNHPAIKQKLELACQILQDAGIDVRG